MTSDTKPGNKFNKSKASMLWLIVLIVVLAVLYLETSMTKQTGYNVVVITDSSLIGNAVFIDNKVVGEVTKASDLGSNTGSICLSISDGTHALEVKKKSETLLKKTIVVKGKSLINLKKSKTVRITDENSMHDD